LTDGRFPGILPFGKVWVKGEKGEVIPFEVGFYCKVVHHASGDDPGSVSDVTELKSLLSLHFSVAFATESG
jgi:hypothetical protein